MFARPSAYEISLGNDEVKYKKNVNREKEHGSWTYYGQSIPFNQDRLARSVDLAVNMEFEIFEGMTKYNAMTYTDI